MSAIRSLRHAADWEVWVTNQTAAHNIPGLDVDNALLLPGPGRSATTRFDFATTLAFREFTYAVMQHDEDPVATFLDGWRMFRHLPTLTQGEPRMVPGRKRLAWRLHCHVQRAHWQATGTDPLLGDVWPIAAYDPDAFYDLDIDFTSLRLDWLREATKDWVRDLHPPVPAIRRALRGLIHVDDALRGDNRSPRQLRATDATTVWRHINDLTYSPGQRASWLAESFQILNEFRAMGVPLHHTFVRRREHVVAKEQREPGGHRSLNDETIALLDAHLHLLEAGHRGIGYRLPAEVCAQARVTLYVLARESGRRIGELCTLWRNCLEGSQQQWSLRYNNTKARRNGRLLPIGQVAADAIRAMQQVLDRHDVDTAYLLPSPGFAKLPHYSTGTATDQLAAWILKIPTTDAVRDRITWHAFRHTYAQRHADAGVDPDVLRQLMDHNNLATTMRYYHVSDERKRKAVEVVNAFTIDRQGRSRPFDLHTRQAVATVAVPHGMCTEPTNVQAGGNACPIRFQCSGCSHYRTDVSYLPQIEEQIAQLRDNHERALAMEVDTWTLTGITTEIEKYESVRARLREQLTEMGDTDRQVIEDHSAALRRHRTAVRRLPLHVIR